VSGLLRRSAATLARAVGRASLSAAERLGRTAARRIQRGSPRSLYRTPRGDLLWLNDTGYVDRQIALHGEFEARSTALVERLVKPGQVVLDVGANIGYYTTILSRLVGPRGKVIAFEPTRCFGEVLERNLEENRVANVEVRAVGLSDHPGEARIDIGPSSATLHSPEGFDEVVGHETIRLTTLVEFVAEARLERIDFIKIDVDGGEPRFFAGAWPVLDRFGPTILVEVSHLHYLHAGCTAWDFYASVRAHGYLPHDEDALAPLGTKELFLRRCGNFDRSANVVLSKVPLQAGS